MKRAYAIVAPLLAGAMLLAVTASHAEVSLPSDGDKEKWQDFINIFAECSAVYNLTASIRVAPEKGTTTYRELANNALISGMLSAEKVGLREDYLESIYSVKMGLWQKVLKDKKEQATLLQKADSCVADALPYQNAIIDTLRNRTAAK